MKISKNESRLRRKIRIRKKVNGTPERPRLCVYRSNSYIYAQLVDDTTGSTIAAASSLALTKSGQEVRPNKAGAEVVGREIAKLAKDKNVETVVFDRNGYIYHGCIKALADGAREGGLKF